MMTRDGAWKHGNMEHGNKHKEWNLSMQKGGKHGNKSEHNQKRLKYMSGKRFPDQLFVRAAPYHMAFDTVDWLSCAYGVVVYRQKPLAAFLNNGC